MVLRRAFPLFVCALLSLFFTGCGSSPLNTGPSPINDSHSSGSVHGGQQPVVGATIQLYAVGTTGDGSAATPLLTTPVTSDANGRFTITGLYSCANATFVYIVATGGNPGLSTTNPNIALMAAVGPCGGLNSSTFISINELTTVAAVSALAPYMSSLSAIGSTGSYPAPLGAAFALANELVNNTTGTAPGTGIPSGYTVPTTELNTLADILSACINSTGGTAGDGSLCGNLFSLTTISPNPAPTNTIAALLNIINNPSQNAAALFALTPPTPPFQPTLTSAPANWQIQLIPPPDNGPVTLTSSANFTILGALQDLTLSNQGTTPLSITSITESDAGGTLAPYFTIAANNCGTSLAAQSSCTISVLSAASPFSVSGQPTTLTGTLTVNDNASSGPQTATLTSTDIYEVTFPGSYNGVVSSGIMSFASEQVGSATPVSYIWYGAFVPSAIAPPIPLTLSGSNPGDFTATGSSLTPPPAKCTDEYPYSNLGDVGPGQCTISLTFKPSAAGQRSAKLSLDPSFGTPTGQYILLQGTGVASGPSFSVTPNPISLESYLPANIDPRSAGSSTLTLTNTGTTTVNLAASFTGAAAPYLTASVSNCSSVAANATCKFTVGFNGATAPGTLSGNLVLADANSSFTLTVPVTGTTAYWQAVANPGQLTFANQAAGTTSSALNFVIADPNGYPLGHAYSVALQPSSSFVLTQGSTCAASTSQTCTLAIAFAPSANGAVHEVATITDQTTNFQSQLALSGITAGASYTLSTSAIAFPAAGINTASTSPIVITLTSNGSQSVAVSNTSISGAVNNNFTQTNNCSTVAAGSTCTINVSFTPTATGTQSATLQIASNALNSPTSVSLTGSAVAATGPALKISPPSLSFTATSLSQTVTITNTTNSPVTINSTSISGATNATFTISSANNCVTTLSAGGTCTIPVTATLSSTAGSGSLVITSAIPDSPQSVALSTSVSAPSGGSTATLTPTSFTSTIWGALKDFTLTNTGSSFLTVRSIAGYPTGGLQSEHLYTIYGGCGTPVAPGAGCTFAVESDVNGLVSQYLPYGVSGVTGQLVVLDDAATGSGQLISSLISGGSYLLSNGRTTGTVGFSANQVGSTQTATIQLASTSGSPAASLTIGGANPGDFSVSALEPSISSSPSTSCPGGGTAVCTITVTFKPTAVGFRSAEISLDSGSSSTGQYLYVAGSAIGPGPSFTIAGNTSLVTKLPVGSDPANTGKQTLTIFNNGSTTLNLASTLTGANVSSFTVDTSQCHSVASQATCPVTLTFAANTVGSYLATLTLYDTSSSASVTFALSGTTSYWTPTASLPLTFQPGPGFEFQFPVSQQVNTTSAPVSFTVTDPNGYPLPDPIAASVSSSNFILPAGSYCPASQPCTLSIAFSPQSTGTLTGNLILTDLVTGATSTIPLSGTATQ